jgi:hypothetical protein
MVTPVMGNRWGLIDSASASKLERRRRFELAGCVLHRLLDKDHLGVRSSSPSAKFEAIVVLAPKL